MAFLGRERELAILKDFLKRDIAGLGVVCGRRRIGKSTLVEYACKGMRFIELTGLAPRKDISNAAQLRHFGELMGMAFKLPPLQFANWNQALSSLAELTSKGRYVIFLDEISWMASKDLDFAGTLKGVWDTQFKKNKKLILILCGSVTSWIEENILENKAYVGRVSLTVTLKELPLHVANQFWPENNLISAYEKFKLLCVMGGVPRYLEELKTSETAEQNIKRLFFTSNGVLYQEFWHIFRDIFGKRAEECRDIVRTLVNNSLEGADICKELGVGQTGAFSKKLKELVAAGFITRDFAYSPYGKEKSLSKYRLSDNYLRFYLKIWSGTDNALSGYL